jgi:hypothetical protein
MHQELPIKKRLLYVYIKKILAEKMNNTKSSQPLGNYRSNFTIPHSSCRLTPVNPLRMGDPRDPSSLLITLCIKTWQHSRPLSVRFRTVSQHFKMIKLAHYFVFVVFVAVVAAIPLEQYQHYEFDPEEVYEIDSPAAVAHKVYRLRRSLQPGAPSFPGAPQQNGGWSVNPSVGRDERGNTRTNVEVQHKAQDHNFNAGWGKVIKGKEKGSPTWHVGGSFRF